MSDSEDITSSNIANTHDSESDSESEEEDIIERFRSEHEIIQEFPSGSFYVRSTDPLHLNCRIMISPSSIMQTADFCVLQCHGCSEDKHFSDPTPCDTFEEAVDLINDLSWCYICNP
jgi:hypothetical protein